MARKRHSDEDILKLLREIEVKLSRRQRRSVGLSRRGYQRRYVLQLAQAVWRDGSVSVVGDAFSREGEYAAEEDRCGA